MTYPITSGAGIIDGLNYVLSGPAGLGQSFDGFSSFVPANLTGNFRSPFTQLTYYIYATGTIGASTVVVDSKTNIVVGQRVSGTGIGVGATVTNISGTTITLSVANTDDVDTTLWFQPAHDAALYVPAINLSNAQQLDNRTIKYTFATPQSYPPFQLGNGLSVKSINPSTYNSNNLKNVGSSINQIGVIECTTTYVVVRTVDVIKTPLGSYVSGGTVGYTSTDTTSNSTDCDIAVLINGAQQRVFISAQLDQTISYTTASPDDLNVYVSVNRYEATLNYTTSGQQYSFENPQTIVVKEYKYPGLSGSGTLPLLETIFTGIYDSPNPGLYRYILEVSFETTNVNLEVSKDVFGLRSISTQVIKP